MTVGWQEWLSLPELGIDKLKVKIDTGAKTSALHTFSIEPFDKDGAQWIRFGIHPIQDNTAIEQYCECAVFDQREVKDSGGNVEQRYVIKTTMVMGDYATDIQMTLTSRDTMKFRMLLGREAMRGSIIVDPEASFLA